MTDSDCFLRVTDAAQTLLSVSDMLDSSHVNDFKHLGNKVLFALILKNGLTGLCPFRSARCSRNSFSSLWMMLVGKVSMITLLRYLPAWLGRETNRLVSLCWVNTYFNISNGKRRADILGLIFSDIPLLVQPFNYEVKYLVKSLKLDSEFGRRLKFSSALRGDLGCNASNWNVLINSLTVSSGHNHITLL